MNQDITHHPDARSLAVQVLLHVSPSHTLQASLDTGLKASSLSHIDHGLVTELAYGTMRYALRLDAVLDTLMKKREALPEEMRMVLRVAAYGVLFLQRVPHHATVNWAVNAVKKRYGQALSKVVNGTLRSLIRLEGAPLMQDFYALPWQFYSVPKWLYKNFEQDYGVENVKSILTRSLARPKIALRLNPRHAKFEELQKALLSLEQPPTQVGWTGLVFEQGNVSREILGQSMTKWHDAGAFSWQAAGSQFVLKECFSNVPELKFSPLWDACAGQGGKSLALIEQGLEVTLASDLHKGRLQLLQDTARRLKIDCPPVIMADASQSVAPHFHGNILLDVPCSGFGTMARRPEIRSLRTQNDVLNLVGLQKKILRSAFASIKVGQYVIYMTCTLHKLENENIVHKFLQENPQGELVYSWQTPHEHPYLEGMFVAVIKKNS